MILQHRNERKRFAKFFVVGIMGTTVDFGIFNLLTQVFGMPPVISSVISFITALTHNFFWHRYWTYPESRSKRVWQQWLQFGTVGTIGLIIRTTLFALIRPVLVSWMTHLVPPLPLTPTFWGNNAALGVVVLTVMLWNFFANRFWTYNDVAVGA
ncbi:MAG: GtrA family protein [Chloroflexi bacterium]|nr:GtrA family protein [Chloroflexota bacterium]